MKKNNVYNLIIYVVSVLYVLSNLISNSTFLHDMVLFEVFYLISTSVFFLIPNRSFNLPCVILRVTGFIRYAVYPVLVYNEGATRFYFTSDVRIIMILEVILVHTVVFLYYNGKYFKRKLRKGMNARSDCEFNVIPMRLGLTTIAVAMIGFFILLRNPLLIKNFFILSFSEKNVSGLGGAGAILFQISVFIALVYLLSAIKKNQVLSDFFKIVLSFVLVVIYANGKGVTAENVSRWGVLVSLITGIVFIFSLYPKAKKTITVITAIIVPVVVVISTLLKKEMWGDSTGGINSALSQNSLNGYFAGSLNIRKGIELLRSGHIQRISTVFADAFANFPMLNHYINIADTTATHFNIVYYGSSIARDQICPMIIQCIEYFGWGGFAAYGIIVFLGIHSYTVSLGKRTLLEKNIYIILTFYFSLIFCLNWSILLEVIWIQVLPLALVNRFNLRIQNRGKSIE